jgi:peptidoglycan L-alanyl-D-glutamate endopeptidase CwlK
MAPINPIIDSRMCFAEAVCCTTAPDDVVNTLCLMDVRYFSFDGRLHQGQLVVHESLRKDLSEIFAIIEKSRFPISQATPIVNYNWSDEASMADNNTSAFNYRTIAGTETLSNHACGMAIDINPFQNPVIYKDGLVEPRDAVYQPTREGVFHESHSVVCEFIKRGWQWGGQFKDIKDYHHFDKKMPAL